ncbi:prolipoprotein diacylglyceryl transferase [Tundrisphaera sp. TA3]|uniref:prolipoprotein diacylglyceryl transferase n=1 Tax=Tundrisphaera sp. TA3 TaxID=3435775 RepID=UPI003EBCD223
MRQILFEIPGLGLPVYGFSIMLVAATFAALYLTAWRARREGIDPDDVYGLATWLLSGGFIGARALFVIQHPESIRSFADIFKVWQGGIVFYGCIIGGLIGSVLYWFRNPFPFRAMADAVAPSLAIGIALGRVGCFFNGCCFGEACDLPWAIAFPAGSLPWSHQVVHGLIAPSASASLPVQPTQIYAVLDGVLLLGLLSAFYPFRRRDGEVMALLMVSYPVTRFFIETLRDDEGVFLIGLTISQFISVVLFPCGLLAWAYLSRLPLGRYADRAGEGSLIADVPAPKGVRRATAVR